MGRSGSPRPRLDTETDAQQVTAVERGYNVFEANCARCHGVNGEGGSARRSTARTSCSRTSTRTTCAHVLTAGGRYVCGNPNSLMPVWSNQANPPGPLNYRQIDELIAFLRATNDQEYIVRDAELGTPKIDPLTGQGQDVHRLARPELQARCRRHAVSGLLGRRVRHPVRRPVRLGRRLGRRRRRSAGASAAPSGGAGASVTITASGIAFTTPAVTVPAETAFTIEFDNQDAWSRTTSQIKDGAGAQVFKADVFPGVAKRSFEVPALAAGTYPFACTVHANMTGTLTAQ